jgi:hypothetical protein
MRVERETDCHDLGAVEHPLGSVPVCRDHGVLPAVARGGLGSGKGDDRVPWDDVLQQAGCDVPSARCSRPAATTAVSRRAR